MVRRGSATKTIVVTAGERPGQSQSYELQMAKLNEQLERMREVQDMAEMRRALERARAELARIGFERSVQASAMRATMPRQPLRYEGTVGCSSVDVHGTSGVNVTVSREGDEIVITTCDAVVRIKAGEKKK
jgi:hypothetical protein